MAKNTWYQSKDMCVKYLLQILHLFLRVSIKDFLQFNPQEFNIVALSNIILPYLSRLFYRSLAFLQNDMMGFRSIRISSELCNVISAKCRPIVIQWKRWTSVTVFASRDCSWKVQYDELEIRQLKGVSLYFTTTCCCFCFSNTNVKDKRTQNRPDSF